MIKYTITMQDRYNRHINHIPIVAYFLTPLPCHYPLLLSLDRITNTEYILYEETRECTVLCGVEKNLCRLPGSYSIQYSRWPFCPETVQSL